MEQGQFTYSQEFQLEQGGTLPGFTLQYSSLGQLNERKDNVVWVCHALTANSDFSDWWSGLVEQQFDPRQYFIICANMLGGCYGSTGPLSHNPLTGNPWFGDFPLLTNRDIVAAFELLRDHLGINGIHTLMGGSMGGQQALEWSISHPDLIQNLLIIASNAAHSPWGVAFNETQRMAIETDPTWGQAHPEAGKNGMKAARAAALLSYRNYQCYKGTQSEDGHHIVDNFKASSYQQYQGDKLYRRFNAYTYWYLSKAMDSHNLARDRGSLASVLNGIRAQTKVIGIRSDILFPLSEQRFLAMHVPHSEYHEIDSEYGHDGFLLELEQLSAIMEGLKTNNSKRLSANG